MVVLLQVRGLVERTQEWESLYACAARDNIQVQCCTAVLRFSVASHAYCTMRSESKYGVRLRLYYLLLFMLSQWFVVVVVACLERERHVHRAQTLKPLRYQSPEMFVAGERVVRKDKVGDISRFGVRDLLMTFVDNVGVLVYLQPRNCVMPVVFFLCLVSSFFCPLVSCYCCVDHFASGGMVVDCTGGRYSL